MIHIMRTLACELIKIGLTGELVDGHQYEVECSCGVFMLGLTSPEDAWEWGRQHLERSERALLDSSDQVV